MNIPLITTGATIETLKIRQHDHLAVKTGKIAALAYYILSGIVLKTLTIDLQLLLPYFIIRSIEWLSKSISRSFRFNALF